MGEFMRAAIYARYSTDRQNENSIETQVRKCRKYAQDHDMIVEPNYIYSDYALSGMKMQRGELQRLLSAAERREFDAVIIYDQSRLSREIVAWFTLRDTLPLYGVELHSVIRGEYGDLKDPDNFLLEGVEAVFNQLHVLTSRKKTIDGLRNIASKGLFAGGSACLGYDIVDRQYVINDREAHVVRLIFEMYASGNGYGTIIDHLNTCGYKTKAGRSFGKNSLYSILTNERYIGTFTFGKKLVNPDGSRNSHKESPTAIRIENAIPSIVEREVWDVVQRKIHQKKQNAANKATEDYLLSGKIYCGECGGAMCGEKRNNGRYLYYICNTRKRLRTCTKKAVRKEVIERQVLDEIYKTLTPSTLENYAQKIYESMDTVSDNTSALKKTARGELHSIETKINNINNAIAEGIYSTSTVTTLKGLEDQRVKLLDHLAELDKRRVETTKSLEDVRGALQYAVAHQGSEKFLINLMLERVTCYENKEIRIILNPLRLDDTDCLGPSGGT